MKKAFGGLTLAVFVSLATPVPVLAQVPPKPGPTPGAAKMIVGTWRLVGARTQAVDGTGPITYPRGMKPSGFIIYHADGSMYVQIMNSDEVRPPRTGQGEMSVEDQAKAFASYTAYFGKYTIDEKEGSVVHHVAGSTNPRAVGNGQKRFLVSTADRLELNTFAKGADGVERITRRMWERVR